MFRSFIVLSMLAIALPVTAQTPAATRATTEAAPLRGTVRDSSGGDVPGATVRVVNETSRATAEAVTDEHGVFVFPSIEPGHYRLELALDGFEAASRQVSITAGEPAVVDFSLVPAKLSDSVVVTARRVEEVAQEVPIPVSVVDGDLVAKTGSFNVNRLKELIPTVQFYSTNPRNSSINIRGLGAPFGLTNDGLDPGVGLYIDGVFFSRPAAATLDFLDVERIEVLRGPQGTLFGKNTTAGAINVTTKKPTFTPESDFELNVGNIGFVQAKASVAGQLAPRLAGRVSFSGTRRDGLVYNTRTQSDQNDLSNLGLRGQVLYAPSDRFAATIATDFTRQRPEGFTQVVAGVAPTLRPANRQWSQIAADLHYTPPSYNGFDRLTDIDTALRSNQDMGGSAVNLDFALGPGRVTTTTAWRYWNWNPSSDRDFVGLPITTISAAPSRQTQWSQEARYAAKFSSRVDAVAGVFVFKQDINSSPSFKQEQGSAAARVLLAPSAAASTPGLLDGYGYDQYVDYNNISSAVFGQISWAVTSRLRLMPGLRFNYDQKNVVFDQQVYGGLQTTDPALIALKLSVLAPQAYKADVDNHNTSGNLTAAYTVSSRVNAYATYATSYKPVGLNMNGLPTDAAGNPVLSSATVRPEFEHHLEVGVKTTPFRNVTANVTAFDTQIDDFQTQVVNASVGVLRGYLANAEKARVRGVEFDGNARLLNHVSLYSSVAYTDGRYVTFVDAPPPLEETGGPQVKDISGSRLPGISTWAASFGGEYAARTSVIGRRGEFFAALDGSYRSSFSSSPSASTYLVVDGYPLFNTRVGFRWSDGWSLTLWTRNLFDQNYYELLTAAPGNTGLYVGQPGDQRTVGLTLRVGLRK